jgi:hypothetical protein
MSCLLFEKHKYSRKTFNKDSLLAETAFNFTCYNSYSSLLPEGKNPSSEKSNLPYELTNSHNFNSFDGIANSKIQLNNINKFENTKHKKKHKPSLSGFKNLKKSIIK